MIWDTIDHGDRNIDGDRNVQYGYINTVHDSKRVSSVCSVSSTVCSESPFGVDSRGFAPVGSDPRPLILISR